MYKRQFRGIPCVYYGSEVEFKKGELIDKGTLISVIHLVLFLGYFSLSLFLWVLLGFKF